jgi:hypothetical protein
MIGFSEKAASLDGQVGRLRGAGLFMFLSGLIFCTSLIAIKLAWLSGGTLVIWPADGLIVGLMLTPRSKRPGLVMVADSLGPCWPFASSIDR